MVNAMECDAEKARAPCKMSQIWWLWFRGYM